MIQVENVGFSYPRGTRVLHDVTFQLHEGQTLGLVGCNGSGKSTLLACLAGLYTPDSGRLLIGQLNSPGHEKEIRRQVGLVLQESDLQILGATVEEDLTLGVDPSDVAGCQRARQMAEDFGLGSLWDAPVQTLSWGQKRKLCVVAILMGDPRLLLLDEPFGGLDYPGILEMRKILRDRKMTRLTQIIASHELEPMVDLVDYWVVLQDGTVALQGSAPEVFRQVRQFGVRPPAGWEEGDDIQSWEESRG